MEKWRCFFDVGDNSTLVKFMQSLLSLFELMPKHYSSIEVRPLHRYTIHYPCHMEHSEVFAVRGQARGWPHFYKGRKLLFQGLWAWLCNKVSRVGGSKAITPLRLAPVILPSHRFIVTFITYVMTQCCRRHVTVQISFLCLSKRACTETAAPCQTNSMMCPRAPIKLHNPRSQSNSTLW